MKELFFTAQTAIPPGVGFPYYGTVHLAAGNQRNLLLYSLLAAPAGSRCTA